MKWANLKSFRCPKCGDRLTTTSTGYECPHVDGYHKEKCGYFITKARFDELIEKMKNKRSPRVV